MFFLSFVSGGVDPQGVADRPLDTQPFEHTAAMCPAIPQRSVASRTLALPAGIKPGPLTSLPPVRAACRTVHGPTTLNPNGRGSR